MPEPNLDHYAIEEEIGDDGYSVHFRAVDLRTQQAVRLRRLDPALSPAVTPVPVPLDDHPHVAGLRDAFFAEGALHLVEMLAAPKSLGQVWDEGQPLAGDDVVALALDLIRALEFAHDHSVVHGALTPYHLYLTGEGLTLGGFGTAQLWENVDLHALPHLEKLAPYLAPEQIAGEGVGPHTDLYAFGVLLYRLLTGSLPFSGPAQEVLDAHLRREPPRSGEISRIRAHLVARLMAKAPTDRDLTAQQVRRILGGLAMPSPEMAHGEQILVGRESHLDALLRDWGEAREGRGKLVFISGAPGIGKSSLARRAAQESQTPLVLTGHCQAIDEAPAYNPFVQVLRLYFSRVPPKFLDDEARRYYEEFVHLLPEVPESAAALPTPLPMEAERAKARFVSGLVNFMAHEARKRPWFLILENLHWADAETLDLLVQLGRRLPSTSMLVVGTYREMGRGRGWDDPLMQALNALSRHPGYRHFPLEPLLPEHVRALLSHVWQQPVPDAVVSMIHRHTEGNPFYVEEVAKWLVDVGAVTQRANRWDLRRLQALELPKGVQEAVWGRLKELAPEIRTLLQKAAVLGERFDLAVLVAMSRLPEEEVLEHLLTALERQLVREAQAPNTFNFYSTEMQDVLYGEILLPDLRTFHRRAGEALEHHAGAASESHSEALARHFLYSGVFERALHYSTISARQAHASHAREAALFWYRRALDVLKRLGEADREERLDLYVSLHEALGEQLFLLVRYDEALEHYNRARERLEASLPSGVPVYDLPQAVARRIAGLYHAIAKVYEQKGMNDRALEFVDYGLDYLDEGYAVPELVYLYLLSGWIYFRRGDFETARTVFERCVASAREGALAEPEADALRSLGLSFMRLDRRDEALAHLEHSLKLCQNIGARILEGRVLGNLGVIYKNLGHFALAKEYQERALRVGRELGDRGTETAALANLGLVTRMMGDYESAQHYMEAVLELMRERGSLQYVASTLGNLGLVCLERGRYARARECFEESLQISLELNVPLTQSVARLGLGDYFTKVGRYDHAGVQFREVVALAQNVKSKVEESEGMSRLGYLMMKRGQLESAESYNRQALYLAQSVGDTYTMAYAFLFLGYVLEVQETWDEAGQSFASALNFLMKLEMHGPASDARAGMARAALVQGEAQAARSYISEILLLIEKGPLEGIDRPFQVYWTCYRVLQAVGDPQARQVLASAYETLQAYAASIEDPELRRSFLDVAPRPEIVAAFEGKL